MKAHLLTLAFAVSLAPLFGQGLDYGKYKDSQKPGLKSDGLDKAKEDLDKTIRENNWKIDSWRSGSDHDSGGEHESEIGSASKADQEQVERYMHELNALTRDYMKRIEEVEGTLDETIGALPNDDISSDPIVKACEGALGIAIEGACGLGLSLVTESPEALVEKIGHMIIEHAPCEMAKHQLEDAIARRCESAVKEIIGNRSISPQERERIDRLIDARSAEMAERRMRAEQNAYTKMMVDEQRREQRRQEANKGAASKATPTMNSNCQSRVPVQVTRAPNFN